MDQKLILLVEDNPDDELLTLDALTNGGVTTGVEVVRDGAEAINFLFGQGEHAGRDLSVQPHLVLLDLKLPKVSGLEVLRRLRADQRTKRIPVVVLTSSIEETDLERSYDLGANSYIQKPVEFDRFIEVVKSLGMYWLLFNRIPAG